jgi:NAD(P)-dependent dehydrogenase (short-subunit alcohol dehydrogenase family)
MATMEGRVALVAGVGPNIGSAVAMVLAEAGAAVVCNDLDGAQAEKTAQDLLDAGFKALAAPGDITDSAVVERLLDDAAAEFGTVDALVNNAAVSSSHGLLDMPADEWQRVVTVTLTGPFLTAQAVARRLVADGKPGAIVNLGSTSGHRGRRNAIAYCSAKGGVLNMTRAMAIDLAPHGIRVNSVSPTKTGAALAKDQGPGRDFSEIPLGRLGRPVDQAAAIRFLLSDEAAFITGEDLRVDGGTLATWGTRSYSPTS